MSRCLVLNASYEYLSIAERWIDALSLVLSKKATPIEEYPEVVRSQSAHYRKPAVVVMNRYVKTKRKTRLWVVPTRQLVFSRDGFRCQYCGVGVNMKTGTRDHVTPLSRGGPDILSNVVTACRDCNGRKDDRTPEEAGMTLMTKPRALTQTEKIQCLLKTCRTRERDTWAECLERIGVTLG